MLPFSTNPGGNEIRIPKPCEHPQLPHPLHVEFAKATVPDLGHPEEDDPPLVFEVLAAFYFVR